MKKNLTGIIGIAVIILVAGVVIAVSKTGDSGSRQADLLDGVKSELVAEENSFDFGTISMAAGNVSHSFKIKNNGAAPVKIAKIYTSCMCTAAYLVKDGKKFGPFGMPGHGIVPKINKVIEAGAEAELQVVFDPTAHGPAGVGPISRAVYFEGDSGGLLELGISAVVTP